METMIFYVSWNGSERYDRWSRFLKENYLPFKQCLDALRKDTLNYSPLRNTGVEYVNLLLIGHVGAGKSSFCNTVNSIFKGSVSHQAIAGSTERSLTNRVFITLR